MNKQDYLKKLNTAVCQMELSWKLTDKLILEFIEIIDYEKKWATENELPGIKVIMQLLHIYLDLPEIAPYGETKIRRILRDHFLGGCSFYDILFIMNNAGQKQNFHDQQERLNLFYKMIKKCNEQKAIILEYEKNIRECYSKIEDLEERMTTVKAVNNQEVRIENGNKEDRMINYLARKEKLENSIEYYKELILAFKEKCKEIEEIINKMTIEEKNKLFSHKYYDDINLYNIAEILQKYI